MNVALIGCGLIGRKRAAALGDARLVACADLDEERAVSLARAHRAKVATTRWQEAVARDDVDIVLVATRHDTLAEVTHGAARAKLIARRLSNLRAADTLADMRHFPGRCHELREDRRGQLALSLDGPYRLIFEPADDPVPCLPGENLDWAHVTTIRILEVVDYHG